MTSAIKYTKQYCYKKGRGKRYLTYFQFYLITKTRCKRIHLHEKVYVYQTIFQSTLDTSLIHLQYKIVIGVLPTNTLRLKY